MIQYSVVLPIYNEESCLLEVVGRVAVAMDSLQASYEIICVDDCSRDATWSIIEALHADNPRVKGLRFFRNFGHQIAVFAGISHSRGSYIAVIDADGQDPPELLPAMFRRCGEGYDVVYAVRRKRKEHLFKRMGYALFYRLFKLIVPFEVPLDSGDFSVFSRPVANFISSRTEKRPFIRGLRSWHGGKQIAFDYERQKRTAGQTKYTVLALVRLALNASVSFSKMPLRIISVAGLIIAPIAFLCGISIVVLKLSIGVNLSGWTSIATLIIFFGGIHLFVLGIIGEYVGDIFDEVKNRPVFLTEQKLGLD